MPWECKSCETFNEEDYAECPTCGIAKTHWTVQGEKTRTFVLSKKKFECRRGFGNQPVSETGAYARAEWPKSRVAMAMEKEVARDLMGSGQRPATKHVLTVRVYPGDSPKAVKLTPRFEERGLEDQDFPKDSALVNEQGWFDARFLLVFGPGDAGDLSFANLDVVDISEDTDTGFAPTIEVKALNKRAKRLKVYDKEPISNPRWSLTEARRGEQVRLLLDARLDAGARVSLTVWEHDSDLVHDEIRQLEGTVEEGQVAVPWTFEYVEDTDDTPSEVDEEVGFPTPEFFFTATWDDFEIRTEELLRFRSTLTITVRDRQQNLVTNLAYILRCANHEKRGTTGEDGVIRESGIPPGPVTIRLEDGRRLTFVG